MGTTEAAVADIWARVLQVPVEAMSVDQDFFDLGGHSLLLTQVAARIRGELEADLPLRVLFEVRTLRALASVVDSWERTPATAVPVADPAAYRGTLDRRGPLTVPAALRERLRRGATRWSHHAGKRQ